MSNELIVMLLTVLVNFTARDNLHKLMECFDTTIEGAKLADAGEDLIRDLEYFKEKARLMAATQGDVPWVKS